MLLLLAERCERAIGADRELDAEIWLACVPGTTRSELRYTHKASGKECVIDETRENGRLIVVPEYSVSLDAAMTLVPEGWNWFAGSAKGARAYVENGQSAFIGIGTRPNPDRLWFEVTAATPALALTAAALRARASLAREPGEGSNG